jgi:plasmid stabilization system protein ParE
MSKRARADVVAACQWWKRNLPDAHVPLVEELRRARQQLATTPWAGVTISDDVLSTLRRLSLVRARYFLFYEVDEELAEVRVLRVWHMSRGEMPKL